MNKSHEDRIKIMKGFEKISEIVSEFEVPDKIHNDLRQL